MFYLNILLCIYYRCKAVFVYYFTCPSLHMTGIFIYTCLYIFLDFVYVKNTEKYYLCHCPLKILR